MPSSPPPPLEFACVRPIERVHRPSREEFRRSFVLAHRPAVITGVASRWPALREWTFERLGARLGELTVEVFHWRGDDGPHAWERTGRRLELQLGECLRRMASLDHTDEHLYVVTNLLKTRPELGRDVEPVHELIGMPAGLPAAIRRAASWSSTWIGPAGAFTPLHHDHGENLNAQLQGRKRWILVSPAQSAAVYFPAYELSNLGYAPVDMERPDLARYPRLAEVTPYECILEPGEILFVPTGWWHHVRSLERSVSLNTWWLSAASMKTHARYHYHRLRRDAARWLDQRGASARSSQRRSDPSASSQ